MQKFSAVGFAFLISILSVDLHGAVVFSDDFENGMGKWTGKNGGSHSATIVPDPLDSGRGNVITFTTLKIGGDIYTTNQYPREGPIKISFDYLGKAVAQSVPNDLGGAVGLAASLNPQSFADSTWPAYTDPTFPGVFIPLIDDGQWRRYTFTLTNAPFQPFRLMLEDAQPSGGVPGDALFDNIEIDIPPTTTIRHSEVEICWQSGIGEQYRVEYRSSLQGETNWQPLSSTVHTGIGGTMCITDKIVAGRPHRFYRVVTVE